MKALFLLMILTLTSACGTEESNQKITGPTPSEPKTEAPTPAANPIPAPTVNTPTQPQVDTPKVTPQAPVADTQKPTLGDLNADYSAKLLDESLALKFTEMSSWASWKLSPTTTIYKRFDNSQAQQTIWTVYRSLFFDIPIMTTDYLNTCYSEPTKCSINHLTSLESYGVVADWGHTITDSQSTSCGTDVTKRTAIFRIEFTNGQTITATSVTMFSTTYENNIGYDHIRRVYLKLEKMDGSTKIFVGKDVACE